MARGLGAPINALTVLPYSFYTGYAIVALLTPLAFLLHLSWPLLIGLHLLIVAALWGYGAINKFYKTGVACERMDRVFWLFVVGATLLAFWKGSYQDGDAWYHLAQANYYAHSERLQSGNAYYAHQPAGTVYDYNAYHLLLAYLSKITGIDLTIIWINLLPVVLCLFLLSLYGTLRVFHHTALMAYLFMATIGAAVLFSNEPPLLWTTLVYDGGMLLLSPVILHLLITQTGPPTARFVLQFFLLGYLLSSWHIFNYVHLFILVALILTVLFFRALRSPDRMGRLKDYGTRLGAYALAGVPYMVLIYAASRSDQPPQSFPGTPLPLVYVSQRLYAFPWNHLYPLTLVALGVTIVFLVTRPRVFRDERRLYFLVPLLFQPFLLYNPVLVPLFARLLHINLVGRFKTILWALTLLPLLTADAVPVGALRAAGGRALAWMRRPRAWVAAGVVLAGLVSVLGYSQRERLASYGKTLRSYDRLRGPFFQVDFFRQIDRLLPPRTVILSDPYTSYHIPAFADQFIYAANVHSIPNLNIQQRFEDQLRIVSPFVSSSTKYVLLQQRGVSFFIVNEDILPLRAQRDPLVQMKPLLTGWAYPDWSGNRQNTRLYAVSDLPPASHPADHPSSASFVMADSLQTGQFTMFTYPAAAHDRESLRFAHASYIILVMTLTSSPPPRAFSLTFSSSYGFHQVLQIVSYEKTTTGWRELQMNTYINQIDAAHAYSYATPVPSDTVGIFISGSPFLDLRLSGFHVEPAR